MRGGYFNTETQRHRGFIPRERKTLCLRVSVLKIVPSFLLSFLIACGAGVQVSCANEDNPAGQQGTYSGVPFIIFDTDIGSSTLTDQAETIFTPSPTGNCRYQLPGTAEWVAQILEKIRRANRQR